MRTKLRMVVLGQIPPISAQLVNDPSSLGSRNAHLTRSGDTGPHQPRFPRRLHLAHCRGADADDALISLSASTIGCKHWPVLSLHHALSSPLARSN